MKTLHNKSTQRGRPPPQQLITPILPKFDLESQHGDPDHPKNWMLLTNRQTNVTENIISLAEIKTVRWPSCFTF